MTTQNQPTTGPQSRWAFDPYHTQVEFATKHLGMMTVRGHFAEISANGNIYPDNPEASSAEVTIQVAEVLAGLFHELSCVQITQCVGWKIADAAHAPVDVLQTAEGIGGRP